jgi:hypothetical protein
MKYCPACNFSFPDFHHVCDFDGTELVSEPDRKPANEARSSRFRSAFKSPAFVSVLLAITLLSSAILIGLLDLPYQSPPAVTTQATPDSVNDGAAPAQPSQQPHRLVHRLAHAMGRSKSHVTARHETTTARLASKKHQGSFASPVQNAEIARSIESQEFSNSRAKNAPAAAVSGPTAAKTSAARNTQIAGSRNFEPVSHQKEPRFTAMLKTTWHVLKKPFKF